MRGEREEKGVGKPLAALGGLALLVLLLFRGSNASGFITRRERGGTCRLKLTGTGIFVNDSPVESIAKAVDLCRQVNAADAEIRFAGDVLFGKLEEAKEAFKAAGFIVKVLEGGLEGGAGNQGLL